MVYSRKSLFAQLCASTPDSGLQGLQSHQCDAIRAILVQNILSNRVQGLLTRQRVTDIGTWMSAYALQIKHHYCAEFAQWSFLRRREGNAELLGQVERVIASIVAVPEARADLGGLAFILVKDKLGRYPFDMALSGWITLWIERCVFLNYKIERAHTGHNVDFDDERPELRRAAQSFDESRLADRRMDINRAFRMLSASDRKILTLKLSGARIEAIAAQVNLAPRTVYARMVRIADNLLDENS